MVVDDPDAEALIQAEVLRRMAEVEGTHNAAQKALTVAREEAASLNQQLADMGRVMHRNTEASKSLAVAKEENAALQHQLAFEKGEVARLQAEMRGSQKSVKVERDGLASQLQQCKSTCAAAEREKLAALQMAGAAKAQAVELGIRIQSLEEEKAKSHSTFARLTAECNDLKALRDSMTAQLRAQGMKCEEKVQLMRGEVTVGSEKMAQLSAECASLCAARDQLATQLQEQQHEWQARVLELQRRLTHQGEQACGQVAHLEAVITNMRGTWEDKDKKRSVVQKSSSGKAAATPEEVKKKGKTTTGPPLPPDPGPDFLPNQPQLTPAENEHVRRVVAQFKALADPDSAACQSLLSAMADESEWEDDEE
jgi:chromosome segregation ATPase